LTEAAVGKNANKAKGGARIINVEIAPGNQRRMEEYIKAYNARSDRRTPKKKYTDVVNEALDRFLDANLPHKGSGGRAKEGRVGKKTGGRNGKRQAKGQG
jgi:hypothetical protein